MKTLSQRIMALYEAGGEIRVRVKTGDRFAIDRVERLVKRFVRLQTRPVTHQYADRHLVQWVIVSKETGKQASRSERSLRRAGFRFRQLEASSH